MSLRPLTLNVEVEMKRENQSKAGWISAGIVAVLTWFLGGIISAGTGRKRGG